jgi:peptidoglycan/LPS O-acetylase OafA/YrhL
MGHGQVKVTACTASHFRLSMSAKCGALRGSGGMTYRPDIDGLRAVAVLAVIGFHAFPGCVPGGFVGVDVFFVISGYLISGLIIDEVSQGRFSIITFYARRARRIFPALIAVLAAVLLFGWALFLPDELSQLGRQIFAARCSARMCCSGCRPDTSTPRQA